MLTDEDLSQYRAIANLEHEFRDPDIAALMAHIDRQAEIIDAYKRGTDNLYVAGRQDIDALTAALAAERALADELAAVLGALEWHDANAMDYKSTICPICSGSMKRGHKAPDRDILSRRSTACELAEALARHRAARQAGE